MATAWRIRGELVLSCNGDVFCPCVVSPRRSQPTRGVCYTWRGLHIEEGRASTATLDGLNVALLMDVPGPLAEGNWPAGLYVDERASDAARDPLVEILSDRAGGPTGWFSITVSNFLGTKRVPIEFERRGRGWRVAIPNIVDGAVEPIEAADDQGMTALANTKYWMAPDVVVCQSTRSRYRDWGCSWDLSGRSGEYARVEWKGP